MTRETAESSLDPYENYFSTTYSHRNDVTPESVQRSALAYRRQLGRYLPKDRDEPLLEIGCGVGGFLLCCRQLGYSQVYGIDTSPEQVARCRDMGFENVEVADALGYLQRTEHQFGAIVLIDVLEHLPRQHILPMLGAAHQKLRVERHFVVRVPNLSNPLNLRTRYVDFTHESGFSQESIAQVLRIAGFDIVTVEGLFLPHRRWLARLVFDRILWQAFRVTYRHTLHLKNEPLRGKNLLAVGAKPRA